MHRRQRIIGYRRNGSPIWLVMGAAPDDEDQGQDETGGDNDDDFSGDEADSRGGDDEVRDPQALLKAYRSEKGKVTKEKGKRAQAQSQLKEFTDLGLTPSQISELAAARRDQGSDAAPDPEEIKRQAKSEAAAEALKERALDKIEVKAAKTFTDPADARGFLASSVEEFIDDGAIDADAIGDALDELLKNKPYLAAHSGRRFQGSGDGGAKPSKPARPTSISEAVSSRYG